MPQTLVIKVIFMHEGRHWVAQGLEYDLAAQGRTVEETKRAFERTFTGRLLFDRERGRQPLSGLPKAPQKFWDIFTAVTRHKAELVAERMKSADDGADLMLPPAFMLSAIQNANHQSQ